MKIGIPKERQDGELRAAATADTIKRYKGLGLEPVVEAGAGEGAAVSDQAFADAGARTGNPGHQALEITHVFLRVLSLGPPGQGRRGEQAPDGRWRAGGSQVEYRRVPGRPHTGLVG